jgi:tetratricopeptide (TPR) repeat protein
MNSTKITLPPRPKSLTRPMNSMADDNQVNKPDRELYNQRELLVVNRPQRMEIPPIFNVPQRDISTKRRKFYDKFLQNNDDEDDNKDKSFVQKKDRSMFIRSPEETIERDPNLLKKVACYEDFTMKKKIKDYNILSSACRRAGKEKDEARSYYSIGVLLDNLGKYKEAIEYYRKFIHICRALKDTQGEAIGYNAIGADYQILGKMEDKIFYERAIEFHSMHKQIANNYGKTIASLNMALCYGKLGNESFIYSL